ncbi:hypothetical protein [Deinococcus piscis]|nr:hypothetical protein [Deinococcus piscis]
MSKRQSDRADLPPNHLAWLYALLNESSFDPWESVDRAFEQALDRAPDAPGQALALERLRHILDTKRAYWGAVARALQLELDPPHYLPELLRWELTTLGSLSEQQLAQPLDYAGRRFSVAGLLRLNARHSSWHAGQVALLCGAAGDLSLNPTAPNNLATSNNPVTPTPEK